MGYAVAQAALDAGCNVTLVSGPVAMDPPRAVRGKLQLLHVETAREMAAAAIPAFAKCDIAFHVAAVADFRPATRIRGKLKKQAALEAGDGRVMLQLVANPDILRSCGNIKHKGQVLVGFALESSNGVRNAIKKLKEKNLDFVILNDPSALNASVSNVTVIGRDGLRLPICDHKTKIARRLVEIAIEQWRQLPRIPSRPRKRQL